MRTGVWICCIGILFFSLDPICVAQTGYEYRRIGNKSDVRTKTTPGLALLGGGPDLDIAARWMCEKSGRGDFLILGTRPTDLDEYVASLCRVNSVSFLMIPNRAAANDPFVAVTIKNAEAIFIDGGEQKDYVNAWLGSRVQDSLNERAHAGIPIGGSSAGLAILGEFSFAGLNGPAQSGDSLRDPYNPQITLVGTFLKLPNMIHTITDQHLIARDRIGRFVVFMARILQDGLSADIRGIGVDENSAVLVNADGRAVVVGSGSGAYFLRPSKFPEVCKAGVPLIFRDIGVYHLTNNGSFDLKTWRGVGGEEYLVSADEGVLKTNSIH
jgi:cyanophycinase